MTHWIIDSGTGISLTNDIKNLHYTSRVNNKKLFIQMAKLMKLNKLEIT